MNAKPGEIIRAALNARTTADAEKVDALIEQAVGFRFERPLGDRVNNFSLTTTSGSYDYKLIENVTNMQDALLEREAMRKYGAMSKVPYSTPSEAAARLLGHLSQAEQGKLATITLHPADGPARTTKRLTAVFRDFGCGIAPNYVAESIFALGSSHKTKTVWQQGAFGIGGATTFRNAGAVILVSRRAPEMNPGEDRILVAVCLWQQSGKGKGLFYLVAEDWKDGDNRRAAPWSTPARDYPEFDYGTHLALINYGTERIHVGHSDSPNSFDRIIDTRLFRPVCAVRLHNHLAKDHPRTRSGLVRRFEDNPREERKENSQLLPFRVGGTTYQLPVNYYVFPVPRTGSSGEAITVGQKANFVAAGHTVMFTSNGQVHHHWTPVDFRERTKLRQLSEHILVIVETDPLPIELRTDLFTPDRSGVRASEETIRLEADVASFLDDWDDLRDLNAQLVRDAIASRSGDEKTLEISKQISRAFRARSSGFKLIGSESGETAQKPRDERPKPPPVLHNDPTMIRGAAQTQALVGSSKTLRFTLDAIDEFFSTGRGSLTVRCNHPDVNNDDISIGPLSGGRIRVIIALPPDAELGDYEVTAGVYEWERASGGLGVGLEFKTVLSVVDEIAPRPTPEPTKNKNGASEGPQVVLIWRSAEDLDLTPKTCGKIEPVPAEVLADHEEFKDLAELGGTEILAILLNRDYAPLKKYLQLRQKALTHTITRHAENRYAIDVGVSMLVTQVLTDERRKQGHAVDEELIAIAHEAAAQGALSILPHFDELAIEAGIEG